MREYCGLSVQTCFVAPRYVRNTVRLIQLASSLTPLYAAESYVLTLLSALSHIVSESLLISD